MTLKKIHSINKTKLQLDNECLTITGIQDNDVLLTNKSNLVLSGMLNGSLFISEDSDATINGVINGSIFGHGSVTISGIVNGSIHPALKCTIIDGAIIKNI